MEATLATVKKIYPELGCVRVMTLNPPQEHDYVPVSQKLRGIYGLPAEGNTVMLVPVSGILICTDIVPKVALMAYRRRYKAQPPKHLRTGSEPRLPFSELLRDNVVVDKSIIKEVNNGAE